MSKVYVGILGAVFLLSPVQSVFSASLYMDPNSAELKRGDTISVAIRIDTDEEECVNVADVTVTYTENILPVDTSRGNSILSVWLEEPVIDTTNRTITFAGGIPNGYCGRIVGDPRLTNTLVELLFRSPGLMIGSTESGDTASISFTDATQVLLNDGFGTLAPLRLFDARISLSKNPGNTTIDDWQQRVLDDDTPPAQFSIALERTQNAFGGKYFIVFNTSDKQSGIDHYEVIEEALGSAHFFSWGASDAPWVRARSPYVLKDQSLNSTIRVKAVDKAGNEYIATYVPDEAMQTLSTQNKILIALVVSVLLLFMAGGVVYHVLSRRKKRTQFVEDKYNADSL